MSEPKIFVADKETQDKIKETTDTILAEVRGQRPKRYGFRVKISEPNPATRVEYLFDAVGMTPAFMDFTNGVFNMGTWGGLWFVRDNYPVMVKFDGTEDYRLDPTDYTKKLKDGSASDVANTAYGGNAMTAIPCCWVKRYEENGYRYVIFCEVQYDESYKAYAHTRADGSIEKVHYMDNFFLFARNKKKLHAMVEALREHLLEQLGLAIKDDWQVYRFEGENRRAGKVTGRAINCLGFVIHNNRVCLRKTILKRIRGKALRMHRKRRCRRIDAAAIISYLGYLQHSDTYNYYKRHIKPNVSIQYCKRRISALAKKSNKEARNAKCPNGTRYTTAGQNSPQSWTPPAAPPPCTNAGISTRRPAR